MKKALKKPMCLALAVMLSAALCLPAFALNEKKNAEIAYRCISIVVGGQTIVPCDSTGKNIEPFILDGNTYLPVRAVANALGLNAGWDGPTSTVTLTSGADVNYGSGTPAASTGKKNVEIVYRDIKIVLDGVTITPKDAAGNPVEPFIMDGSTYLPVRAVANALGVDVNWVGETSTVTLGALPAKTSYLLSKETTEYYCGGTVCETDSVSYTYDKNGNILTATYLNDGYGETSSYTYHYEYDSQGRLLKQYDLNDGETYTYAYDSYGNLSKYAYTYMDYSESSVDTYDAAGNLIKRVSTCNDGTESYTDTTVYTFDAKGNCLSESYNDGEGYSYYVKYTYNAAGHLTNEVYSSSTQEAYTEAYTYDAAGNILTDTFSDSYGSSYVDKYTYDKDGNMLTDCTTYSYGYTESFAYSYDKNGNVLMVNYSDSDGYGYSVVYTYDAKGNLLTYTSTEADGYVYACEYTYDENGNILRSVTKENGEISSKYSCEYISIENM